MNTPIAKYNVNDELNQLYIDHNLAITDKIEILKNGNGFAALLHFTVKDANGTVIAQANYFFNAGPARLNRYARAKRGGGRWAAYVSLVAQIKTALAPAAA